jgi:hypothetical protein
MTRSGEMDSNGEVYGERGMLEGVQPWLNVDTVDMDLKKRVGECVSLDEDPESCESSLSEDGGQEMVSVVEVEKDDDGRRIYLDEGVRIDAQIRLAWGWQLL